MKLNRNQKFAIESISKDIVVLACAGSGKTEVLTQRIIRLLKEGFSPKEICAVTFTRKATGELRKRIDAGVGAWQTHGLRIGTFHSLCLEMIESYPVLAGYGYSSKLVVYDEEDKASIMKEIKGRFSTTTPERIIRSEYLNILQRSSAIDYDMMIEVALTLLQDKQVQQHYHAKYRFLFVDEFQDTDINQIQWINRIKPEHLFVVGDDDQCQPPGTKVLTTEGYINIEKLEPKKHSLVCYDRRGSLVIGQKKGYHFKKSRRSYHGKLITIHAGNFLSQSTPEHRWPIKWTKSTDYYVVYLMGKGNWYRVGYCQLFNNEQAFNLGARSRLEQADNAWILTFVKSKCEAYSIEAYISAMYGIPMLPFKETNGASHITQRTINEVFGKLEMVLKERAEYCLEENGRDIKLPFWNKFKAFQRRGGKTIIDIEAINLLPGIMNMAIHIGGKKVSWEPIYMTRENYNGHVYSLEVPPYHTYISDSIITNNCIYGWRGTDVKAFREFQRASDREKILLPRNYRSTSRIIEVANAVIAKEPERIKKTMVPAQTAKKIGDVAFSELWNPMVEGMRIKHLIKNLNRMSIPFKEIAILGRTNRQLDELCQYLETLEVPVERIGRKNDLWKKAGWRLGANILRLLYSPWDAHVYKSILRELGTQKDRNLDVEIIHNTIRGNELWNCENSLSGIFREAINSCEMELESNELSVEDFLEAPAHSALEFILSLADVYGFGTRESTGLLKNRRGQLDKLLAWLLKKDWSIKQFVQWFNFREVQDELEDPDIENKVKLMTVHVAKGLEFEAVIIPFCNSDTWPNRRSDPNEERRLIYVAITRAKSYLFFTRAEEDIRGAPTTISSFMEDLRL